MNRRHVIVAALVVLGLILVAAGCRNEPSEPRVVPPQTGEPTATPTSEEPSATLLADISIALEPIAEGFDEPLYVTSDGTGSGVLYVVERPGRIWTLANGQRGAAPFLDISNKVSTTSEQGLLGLAFPADYATSGRFVVSYTRGDGANVLSTMAAGGGVADPASERVLLTVPQPYANHNGGMIEFGPDGMLYMGIGDGGSGGDPHRNGQNLGTLLGKLLRLDVTAADSYRVPADNPFASEVGARAEIWAYGLRNPWRFSFDRATGDLWIGDVGQNAWEEIDFQPAASAGGENYGWNRYEGAHTYPAGEPVTAPVEGFTLPIVEYDRQAGKSVTGGYVYRGAAEGPLWGTYFYADYVDGRIWGLQRGADGAVETRLLLDNEMQIVSFGEDDGGELYVVDFSGAIYRMFAQ